VCCILCPSQLQMFTICRQCHNRFNSYRPATVPMKPLNQRLLISRHEVHSNATPPTLMSRQIQQLFCIAAPLCASVPADCGPQL